MRKVFALCLICSLPFLVGGCGNGQGGNDVGAQEQIAELPRYGFESDHISMVELGEMLERMGREIQQNGAVTFAGNTYPLAGYGGIEFNLGRREGRDGNLSTGFQMDINSDGSSDPPTPGPRGGAYTLHQGHRIQGTPAELADAIDEMASTLESTGAFAWDFHTADFVGTAVVDQMLGQNTRNPRQPYRLMFEITYGEGEFERHDDREDVEETVERGQGVWLGDTSVEGADQAGVVEALRALSAGIRSGQVVVGEGQAELGDEASLNFGHVAVVGGADKIEMGLQWPSLPAPEPVDRSQEPRYSDEPWAMPITEFAEMLQRIATEILEDGTFIMDGEEYTVGETVGGEIGFSSRGMAIEVGWRR
jgi:hypothetical protein